MKFLLVPVRFFIIIDPYAFVTVLILVPMVHKHVETHRRVTITAMTVRIMIGSGVPSRSAR